MAKILIIDDEPAYQKILKDTFEKEKFEIILASDGKQGLIEAAKNQPDFILLDLIMPGMNGGTLLRHVGDVNGLKNIPIAILSAVPDGVPQRIDSPELYKNIVGYWVKDQNSLPELVKKVKDHIKL